MSNEFLKSILENDKSVVDIPFYDAKSFSSLIGVNDVSCELLLVTESGNYIGKCIRYSDRLIYVTLDYVEIEGVIKFCMLCDQKRN